MRRLFLDERSARIAKAEKLRCLVKGFADGVVDRAADADVVADAVHAEDLRVAAGITPPARLSSWLAATQPPLRQASRTLQSCTPTLDARSRMPLLAIFCDLSHGVSCHATIDR